MSSFISWWWMLPPFDVFEVTNVQVTTPRPPTCPSPSTCWPPTPRYSGDARRSWTRYLARTETARQPLRTSTRWNTSTSVWRRLSGSDWIRLNCVGVCCSRLYQSVPVISRLLGEDLVIEGKTIPAGTNVILCKFLLHRDPTIYPEPETFDPDRFLPENAEKRNPFAYVPFSAGPRNCIGQKYWVRR